VIKREGNYEDGYARSSLVAIDAEVDFPHVRSFVVNDKRWEHREVRKRTRLKIRSPTLFQKDTLSSFQQNQMVAAISGVAKLLRDLCPHGKEYFL